MRLSTSTPALIILSLLSVPAAAQDAPAPPADERRVLYWYDPMVPSQRFDKPGKSPFMDMELVPKYADEGGDAASVSMRSFIMS